MIITSNVGQDAGAVSGFLGSNNGPFFDSLNHGDDNLIRETIDRMRERLTKGTAGCKDMVEVLNNFGKLAHTLQDLYSHSTYVETFGKTARSAKEIPLWTLWTHEGSANIPSDVISGVYKYPRDNAPGQSHLVINKDSPGSLRGKQKNSAGVTWFTLAEGVARRHTTELWKELVRGLSAKQRRELRECCH